MSRGGAVVVVLLFVSGPVSGQSAGGLCFHPRPGPRCDWTLVTEAGPVRRVVPVYPYRELSGVGAVGLLRRLPSGDHVGATFVVQTNFDDRVRIGLAPAGRRWLGSWGAVDVAAGPTLATESGSVGLMGRVGLNLGGWLTVQTQLDRVPNGERYGGLRSPWHWSVGVSGGSYLGAAGIAGGLLAVFGRAWKDSWSGF
jgi:hypothetical protein